MKSGKEWGKFLKYVFALQTMGCLPFFMLMGFGHELLVRGNSNRIYNKILNCN